MTEFVTYFQFGNALMDTREAIWHLNTQLMWIYATTWWHTHHALALLNQTWMLSGN